MLRVPSLKMKRLGYLIAYSLVLLVYRSLPIIAMPRKKCGELIRRLLGQPFSVPAEKRRVGSVHLLGPDQWLAVINSALTQLSEEDPALYSAITSGRKCVIFAGGTATGDHYFEYGTFFFGRALVKSTDGLIAFFVFWHYFNLASSWLERVTPTHWNGQKQKRGSKRPSGLKLMRDPRRLPNGCEPAGWKNALSLQSP